MIDAARHNSPSTADAFATQVRGYWRRWRCRWATGSQTNPSFRSTNCSQFRAACYLSSRRWIVL